MAAYTHGKSFEDRDDKLKSRKTGTVSAETTPSGKQPIKWVLIEKTMGLIPAQIMADRLQYEGIQARAIQEGAGAFGLTVGILGEGRVYVPSEQEEEARLILAEVAKESAEFDEEE
ncbi:MAG TPA: hypothetical protein ENJ56_08195 [Anaerolineae bacterium]|nr:hypothetical protein [Anaerolineae bacterium]